MTAPEPIDLAVYGCSDCPAEEDGECLEEGRAIDNSDGGDCPEWCPVANDETVLVQLRFAR